MRYKIGNDIEEDYSCDSDYMIKAMDQVGVAIHKTFHWIPDHQTCYLVTNDAGGHGINADITQYTSLLFDKYNVKLIFQVPISPYTNTLDLVGWMCLHAFVESEHYLKYINLEALCNSVLQTWNNGGLDVSITKVFDRIRPVLCNILEGGGRNELVEKKEVRN